MPKKAVSKKDAKEEPIVSELKKIFGESLLSVSRVEFVKEDDNEGKKEINIPKTEEQVISVINDLVDEKIAKLMENYKSQKVKILPLSGLWQSCYDQKYDLMDAITNPKSSNKGPPVSPGSREIPSSRTHLHQHSPHRAWASVVAG